MIWYWLAKLGDLFVYLFGAVKPRDVAKIDKNAACGVCGARKGRLRTVVLNVPKQQTKVFCRHTCRQCGARWFEEPVLKVTAAHVWHAVPRNRIEATEDAMFEDVRSKGMLPQAVATKEEREKVN